MQSPGVRAYVRGCDQLLVCFWKSLFFFRCAASNAWAFFS